MENIEKDVASKLSQERLADLPDIVINPDGADGVIENSSGRIIVAPTKKSPVSNIQAVVRSATSSGPDG